MHLPSAPDHDYCLSTPRLPEHHLIHLALVRTLVVAVQVGVVVQALGVEVLDVEVVRAVDETLVPVPAQQHGALAPGAASQAAALVVAHDAPAEVEPEAPYLGYLGSVTPHAIPAVEATLVMCFPMVVLHYTVGDVMLRRNIKIHVVHVSRSCPCLFQELSKVVFNLIDNFSNPAVTRVTRTGPTAFLIMCSTSGSGWPLP